MAKAKLKKIRNQPEPESVTAKLLVDDKPRKKAHTLYLDVENFKRLKTHCDIQNEETKKWNDTNQEPRHKFISASEVIDKLIADFLVKEGFAS